MKNIQGLLVIKRYKGQRPSCIFEGMFNAAGGKALVVAEAKTPKMFEF